MAYFDTKSGSLEEAIRGAVRNKINEAKIILDLENDDPKLIKDIKKFGLKVKDLGFSGNDGYNEYEISGDQKKIAAANKKLNLMASYGMKKMDEKKLDPVGKEDGDIDNDGDEDETDKYLAKRRKAIGKAMKKDKMDELTKAQEKLPPALQKAIKAKEKKEKNENYDVGTQENTKAKLDATPGQSSDDWQQQVETMQKKNASMREALAKVWGVDEGKNPFKTEGGHLPSEKKKKEEDKTMTGKPMTKVAVDPDMKEVKLGKKNVR